MRIASLSCLALSLLFPSIVSAQATPHSTVWLSRSVLWRGQEQTMVVTARDLDGHPLPNASVTAALDIGNRGVTYQLGKTNWHGKSRLSFPPPAGVSKAQVAVAITIRSGPLTIPVFTRFAIGQPLLPTVAPTPSPSPTPAPTNTPVPTDTPVPTATLVPTSTPTATDTPVPTNTSVPTDTPIPTDTPVPTSTPVPTAILLPTATLVPTDTPAPTTTLVPTSAPAALAQTAPAATVIPTSAPTPVPSDTPTPTVTPVPATATPTPTDTPIPTDTPVPAPIDTAVPAQYNYVATNTPVPVSTAGCPGSQSGCIQAVLNIINSDRAQYGLLAYSLNMTQSTGSGSCIGSYGHSVHMANEGHISHDDFPADICVPFSAVAENVGYEQTGNELQDLQDMDNMMMSEPHSPGCSGNHACNILSPAYRQVGIGIYTSNGTTWLTEDFIG